INSILYNNSPPEIYFSNYYEPNSVTIAYSDLMGGEAGIVTNNNATVNWLDGNIDQDPLFVDPENNDYHLQPDSPCIDAGIDFFTWEGDTLVNLTLDQYFGLSPDMGAYEYEATAIEDVTITTPSRIELLQNYPNPFNPSTTIQFAIPSKQTLSFRIYDITGRLVKTLL
ncbi:MAG: T9SS type A sorting domain-containing protein, partial [Planctomycetes bacterium]|nr:T9SS type A sorting domain-containing protein [Planctomycetota bacterium]